MAKYVKPLSDSEIKRMKPESKLYRKSDGNGLSIKIMPSGNKIWEYRFINPETKKEDTLVIGDYPTISLSDARKIHQDKRALVLQDINPKRSYDNRKFSTVFEEWFPIWAKEKKSAEYATDSYKTIKNDCMKILGHMNIDEIEPKHILESLQPFVKRGALGRIPKIKPILKQVFDYAVVRGMAKFNPVLSVPNSAFPKHKSIGHRALNHNNIYTLHNFFAEYKGEYITKKAVELLLRTTSRAKEICMLKWENVDFEKQLIIIPEELMKKNTTNIIPMCFQVEELMKELYEVTGSYQYVLPNDKGSHIYTKTPTRALLRFNIESTAHGFRTLASTVFYEAAKHHGASKMVIESCLAHKDKDQSASAYNKAEYIHEKRKLYQWWNDLIDMCDTKENNLKALKKFNII